MFRVCYCDGLVSVVCLGTFLSVVSCVFFIVSSFTQGFLLVARSVSKKKKGKYNNKESLTIE